MQEQETPQRATATVVEPEPYSELKRIIEEETARADRQQNDQRTSRPPTTQPSDASRPTARYGLD